MISLSKTYATKKDKAQHSKGNSSLGKNRISIALFALISLTALITAYVQDSVFFENIAVALFIVGCIAFIKLMSGDIKRN